MHVVPYPQSKNSQQAPSVIQLDIKSTFTTDAVACTFIFVYDTNVCYTDEIF